MKHSSRKDQNLPKIIVAVAMACPQRIYTGHVKAVYDELLKESPKNGFTVGINDDVTFTSLAYDRSYKLDERNGGRASSSV